MHIFSTINETKNYLKDLKKRGKKIGFVPTMGALHPGHITLLQKAKKENEIAVSSIFVNPLQFNDKKDLDKYPKTLEKDIESLKRANCDVLFTPSVEEMYPTLADLPVSNKIIDLGTLDKIMEGKQRPGHFQGVCVVVKKLFEIVEPDKAYFGEKDFQQLAIIKHMTKSFGIPVEIIPCQTVRETDGLAMSSRNTLLSTEERKNASLIFKTLSAAKERSKTLSVTELQKWVEQEINKSHFLKLEYFDVVNAETLEPIAKWEEAKNIRACIAVKAGAVRLIDNIQM